jgi:GYF domain 2/PilZ domain
MADNWYYVHKGNRQGPVDLTVIEAMMAKNELKADDYVWKKGFENWMKIKEVTELAAPAPVQAPVEKKFAPPGMTDIPKMQFVEVDLKSLKADDRAIFIRIGADRGGANTDYGPFTMGQLKQLFNENRINGKTFVFVRGMRDWKLLADFPEYQEIFEELPPVILESDRRANARKPFVARLFVQNNKSVSEGICRDISIGGMQVLLDGFNGKAGDKISINVHPENSDYHFTASGQVVRLLEGNLGFSFRFQALSDEAKRSVEKYLQEN